MLLGLALVKLDRMLGAVGDRRNSACYGGDTFVIVRYAEDMIFHNRTGTEQCATRIRQRRARR